MGLSNVHPARERGIMRESMGRIKDGYLSTEARGQSPEGACGVDG